MVFVEVKGIGFLRTWKRPVLISLGYEARRRVALRHRRGKPAQRERDALDFKLCAFTVGFRGFYISLVAVEDMQTQTYLGESFRANGLRRNAADILAIVQIAGANGKVGNNFPASTRERQVRVARFQLCDFYGRTLTQNGFNYFLGVNLREVFEIAREYC